MCRTFHLIHDHLTQEKSSQSSAPRICVHSIRIVIFCCWATGWVLVSTLSLAGVVAAYSELFWLATGGRCVCDCSHNFDCDLLAVLEGQGPGAVPMTGSLPRALSPTARGPLRRLPQWSLLLLLSLQVHRTMKGWITAALDGDIKEDIFAGRLICGPLGCLQASRLDAPRHRFATLTRDHIDGLIEQSRQVAHDNLLPAVALLLAPMATHEDTHATVRLLTSLQTVSWFRPCLGRASSKARFPMGPGCRRQVCCLASFRVSCCLR